MLSDGIAYKPMGKKVKKDSKGVIAKAPYGVGSCNLWWPLWKINNYLWCKI